MPSYVLNHKDMFGSQIMSSLIGFITTRYLQGQGAYQILPEIRSEIDGNP